MAADFGITGTEPSVPGFELKHILGEGSSGVVWFAVESEDSGREVALKILKPGLAGSEAGTRFQVEMQALALMDHPGIAKVYASGETRDGRPFFAMEWVDGQPVDVALDLRNATPGERLKVFEKICVAMVHAHGKGIIHRDLKPSNILLGADREPRVIDFGIARATEAILADRTLVTRDGQMVGTPAYMSPEQAAMRGEMLDERSDIYSLGVVLYELLSGKLPIRREVLDHAPYDEVLREIRTGKIPDLSRDLPEGVSPGIALAVMKALRKNPADRYQRVEEFLADLQNPGKQSRSIRPTWQAITGIAVCLGLAGFLIWAPWKNAPVETPREATRSKISARAGEVARLGPDVENPQTWRAYGEEIFRDDPGSAIAAWAEARRLALLQNGGALADSISNQIDEALEQLSPEYATAVRLMLAHDFHPKRGDRIAWMSSERRNLLWARSRPDQDSLRMAVSHLRVSPWDRVRWGIAGREALQKVPKLVEAGDVGEAIRCCRSGLVMCGVADQPAELMSWAAAVFADLKGGHEDEMSLQNLLETISTSELVEHLGIEPLTVKWLEGLRGWHDPDSPALAALQRVKLLPGWHPLLLQAMGDSKAAAAEARRELSQIDREAEVHLASVLQGIIDSGE